jgi:peptidoglycan/LPS O-acetylase OafA/YrhL
MTATIKAYERKSLGQLAYEQDLAEQPILVLSLQGGLVSSITRHPLLRWFGDISYGLYVIHELLNLIFSSHAATLAPHAGPDALHALKFFLGVSISITLAWISRRFFEAPFLKLRSRYKPQPVAA